MRSHGSMHRLRLAAGARPQATLFQHVLTAHTASTVAEWYLMTGTYMARNPRHCAEIATMGRSSACSGLQTNVCSKVSTLPVFPWAVNRYQPGTCLREQGDDQHPRRASGGLASE